MRLAPEIVIRQIENLLIQFPELAEDDVLRADCVEGETDAHKFLGAIEMQRREAVAQHDALDQLIASLSGRQERFARREQAIRGLMFRVLEAANIRKIELPCSTLSIRKGVPRVIITDDALISRNLCRTVVEPNKAKIRELLMAGQIVAGAELSNAEDFLSIR